MERVPITEADQRKRRRKIMREFRLHELSAVDRPAQQHARMTLMKRDDTSLSPAPVQDAENVKVSFGKGHQAQLPKRDDDDRIKQALDCQYAPFFSAEFEHYTALADYASKHAFLSADHDQRATMIRKVAFEKEHDMPTFRTLEEAAQHYQKTGMSENLAKRTAASTHPELRYTTEADAVAKSEVGEIRKAAASGAIRRQQIDDLVTSTARDNKVSRQQALRMLRHSHPQLFGDN